MAFDFDKDGWMDLAFTHAGAPGISLWRNVEGKRLERVPLPDLGWQHGWGISAIDYDNDGWIDLVAVGEPGAGGGEIRLLRNLGTSGWADVTKDTHLDAVKLTQPRAVAVADIDGNGSADLLVTQAGGEPVLLRNEGATQHNWMRIDLKALNDNKSGFGTKVELYAGPLYQKWEVGRFVWVSWAERAVDPCGTRLGEECRSGASAVAYAACRKMKSIWPPRKSRASANWIGAEALARSCSRGTGMSMNSSPT